MADAKKGQWTDGEKIIDKGGKIPWAELTLPAGRTKKACEVMISAERQKLKTASNGETKKRAKQDDNGYDIDPPAKKSKTSRKKKAVASAQDDKNNEEQNRKAEDSDDTPDFT